MFAVAACAARDSLPGYAPASAADRALVVRTVEDYFAKRERAAITGDASEFFAAYPALALHEDRRQGINTETFFVERARLAASVVLRMSHQLEASFQAGG